MRKITEAAEPPTAEIAGFKTIEQAAVLLNCSVSTVWRRLAARGVATVRLLGRSVIAEQDIEILRATTGDRARNNGVQP